MSIEGNPHPGAIFVIEIVIRIRMGVKFSTMKSVAAVRYEFKYYESV